MVVGDVTEEADIERAVQHADGSAPLTVAILAAGVGGGASPIISTSWRAWRRVLSVNLDGAFLTLRSCAKVIARNGGGSIVAISSVAAASPARSMGPYAVSKAGLEALVTNAANELGADSVRVNAIRAGLIDTDLTAPLFLDESFVARQMRQTPLVRLGSTADVAEAVSFLIGPQATWITGTCLAVDGGNHLRGSVDVKGSD